MACAGEGEPSDPRARRHRRDPEARDRTRVAVDPRVEGRGRRELAVAKRLAECEGVAALHDRRVPGTKGNIDHLAIGPGGVYIIDAKRYGGKVERRDVGSFFRPDVRLYVNNRDRSKVVKGMGWQVVAVRKALDAAGHAGVPLCPVLCFVEAEWSLFAKPILVDGVTVLWPKAMQDLVRSGEVLDAERIDRVTRDLATALPVR